MNLTHMMKLYSYVGPANIRARAATSRPGQKVRSVHDLDIWIRQSRQRPDPDGLVVVTFVVDELGDLRVADRGSEHIACSGGRCVQSAGEMFLARSDTGWHVEEASNQSTGFCPEPESWPAVADALDRIGILHPGRFTREITFRRCPACSERNIVKDGWFICVLCGADRRRRGTSATHRRGTRRDPHHLSQGRRDFATGQGR